MEIEDYLGVYPSTYETNYQKIISSKEEYVSLASGSVQEVPAPGEYYPHQKLTHRILLQQDRIFVMSETGTGKSLEILGATEEVIDAVIANRKNPGTGDPRLTHFLPTPNHRIHFVSQGKAQKTEMRYQLVCKFANSRYLKELGPEISVDKSVKIAIGKYYNITSYQAFANRLSDLSDEQIIALYSHTIIWIDEAHNLIVTYEDDGDEGKQAMKQHVIFQLLRLSSLAKYCKIILTSATPMLNDVKEITSFFNIVLDHELPYLAPEVFANMTDMECKVWFPTLTPKEVRKSSRSVLASHFRGTMDSSREIASYSEEELEIYFRGRITFVKSLDTGVDLRYQGESISEDIPQIVYPVPMGKNQVEAYINKDNIGSYNIPRRQISTFVYPNGKYKDEKGRYIRDIKGSYFTVTDEFKQAITPKTIHKYSGKFKVICEAFARNEKRAIFVYIPFINGAGAYALGACLEQYGIVPYREKASIFKGGSGESNGYCSSADTTPKTLIGSYPLKDKKGKPIIRYAILVEGQTEAERSSIMEVFHSKENMRGEIIKGIIVTRIGRDGINLSNIMEAYIPYPEYNTAVEYQAISRFMRSTSHVDLLRKLRLKDPDARLEAKAYLMVGYYNGEKSYDYEMVRLASEKALPIARMMRIIERVNITCNIHKDRNVVRGQDGSQECRFAECDYDCYQQPYDEIDYSTYDAYFSDAEVERVEKIVIEFFSFVRMATLDEISQYCNSKGEEIRTIIVVKAINNIITNKTPFYNSFGFRSYLYKDDAGFHSAREYTSSSDDSRNLWYSSGLLVKEKTLLLDYLYIAAESNNEEIKTEINTLGTGEALYGYLRALSPSERIFLLEMLWAKKFGGKTLTRNEGLTTEFYSNYTFRVPYITDEQLREGGRERKGDTHITNVKATTLREIYNEIEARYERGDSSVRVHTLYSISTSDQSNTSFPEYYNASVTNNTLRILDKGKWRTCAIDELETALGYVKATIYHNLVYTFPEAPCYVIVIKGEEDKILIKSGKNVIDKRTGKMIEGTRNIVNVKGKACTSLNEAELDICVNYLKGSKKEISREYASFSNSGAIKVDKCISLIAALNKLGLRLVIS